jgi:hypothetical protein
MRPCCAAQSGADESGIQASLFAAVPAIRAQTLGIQADRLEHAIERLESERVESELVADALQEPLAALGCGVRVLVKVLLALVALELPSFSSQNLLRP